MASNTGLRNVNYCVITTDKQPSALHYRQYIVENFKELCQGLPEGTEKIKITFIAGVHGKSDGSTGEPAPEAIEGLEKQKVKSSRCPKLDGYAIANFGVRVERELVKWSCYWGTGVESSQK